MKKKALTLVLAVCLILNSSIILFQPKSTCNTYKLIKVNDFGPSEPWQKA